ncbi:MAG: hypothetical protein WB402_15370 [Sulfuricaulis sp.]|uniref:hypothetical protein n=1 Tax=Sulfuricaulis sp. TaxID=2003553 RepID=UPI003C355E8D
MGKHKTSIQQDIEIDALAGAVIEPGKITQTTTPHIDSVYACVKLLAKTSGEEKGKLKIEKIKGLILKTQTHTLLLFHPQQT